MERHQVHSTIFVPSGSLGMPPQWIRRPDHPALRETVMDGSELCSIAQNPLVIVGSHSVHHPDFLKLDPQAALSELSESKERLESILGRPVTLFSFPHGRFSEAHLVQAGQAGYERTFGIQPTPIDGSAQTYSWGRVAVEPDDWPIEFHLKLLGAYRWMASRQRA
jgi:peptidoglycan/xylan/chitin deacetylase (PgdA/CDA1 family)